MSKSLKCPFCGSVEVVAGIPPKGITRTCTHLCSNCGLWSDLGTYPRWTGTYRMEPSVPESYVMRRKIFWKEPVPLMEFWNNPDDPLTLWLTNSTFIRPFRHFDKCDFGSIPLALQSFVSPTCAVRSFICHDSGYEFNHRWSETGLTKITQRQCDDMLYIGMRAEGCNKFLASKAWLGVRAGGWTQWAKNPLTVANAVRLELATGTLHNPENVV